MAKERENPDEMDLAAGEEILEFLRSKRSVRNFEKRPIPPVALEQMAQAASTAPYSGSAPGWHLIAVTDSKVLSKVQQAASSGLNRLNFWVHAAPAILVCCAKPGLSRKRQGIPYYAVDAAIALERASLMAHQLGFGSCWIGRFDERAVRRACRIPSAQRVVALLAVGYPKEGEESFLGIPVINDFAQYYDLARAKYEKKKRVSLRSILSYNYFP